MDKPYAPPSILRLTGIALADYVSPEDVADAKLLEPSSDGGAPDHDEPTPEGVHPPDKIPRVFAGLDDWPHRTNLKCWVCDFTFDDRPKFVPRFAREGGSGVEFGVLGNMCTFNCAELWIETNLGGRASNEERWQVQDNLRLLYFVFTGARVSRIKPAYRKTEMRKYGGEWDEETFWKKMRELDPVAGLRDHTPGSVVPERNRAKIALTAVAVRNSVGGLPTPRVLADKDDKTPGDASLIVVSERSAWAACGLATRRDLDSIPLQVADPEPGGAVAPSSRDDNLATQDMDIEDILAGRGDVGGVGAGALDADDIDDLLGLDKTGAESPGEDTGTLIQTMLDDMRADEHVGAELLRDRIAPATLGDTTSPAAPGESPAALSETPVALSESPLAPSETPVAPSETPLAPSETLLASSDADARLLDDLLFDGAAETPSGPEIDTLDDLLGL